MSKEEMTREEHLEWAKQRALEYCDRGELQHALDSLISDLFKHPGAYNVEFGMNAVGMWMEGKLDTADKMREFINGLK